MLFSTKKRMFQDILVKTVPFIVIFDPPFDYLGPLFGLTDTVSNVREKR